MSVEDGPEVIVVPGARYTSWFRDLVRVTDGNGNDTNIVRSLDDPAIVAFVEGGGRIEDPGAPEEELAWLQDRKAKEIEHYADERLKRNEPNHTRRARLARVALTVVSPATVSIDVDATRFDAETLACAENYIRHVREMRSTEAVKEFDPALMAWPKLT